MQWFDFKLEGVDNDTAQAFGFGAIISALSKAAEPELDLPAEDYHGKSRQELKARLEELQDLRESLEADEPDDFFESDAHDAWEEQCEELENQIDEIEGLLDA